MTSDRGAGRDNLDGLFSPFLRRQRIRAARPFIGGRVLDFGCGTGLLGNLPEVESYVGVDIDEEVLRTAAALNPDGRFLHPDKLPAISGERFDTVVALAVIEHLPDGVAFLGEMAGFLADRGVIVLTTPNPALDWVHGIGSRLGLFARESHEEHQNLMGKGALLTAAIRNDLQVVSYRRFLGGANQLLVLRRGET